MAFNHYAIHARGFAMLQNKMGASCPQFLWNRGVKPIAFNGTDAVWAIVPSTVDTKERFGPSGFGQVRSLRFSALTAQFYTQTITTPEQVKAQMDESQMGYLGAAYKITDVAIAPGGLVLTIDANAYDQGA